jgi:hypothetical protein
MSAQFWPCPGCSRHVRRGDAICPFCGATASVVSGPTRVLAGRLSRVALFAAGAMGAAVATTDCGTTAVPAYGGMACPTGCQSETTEDATAPDAADVGMSMTTMLTDSSTPSADATSAADVSTDAADASATTMPTDSATHLEVTTSADDGSADAGDASATDSSSVDDVILTVTHYGGIAPPDE